MKRHADNHHVEDGPLLGAWETSSGVVVGGLINGAPVVRDEPEELLGELRARHRRVVPVRWASTFLDDTEGVYYWPECMCSALEDFAPPLPTTTTATLSEIPAELEHPIASVGYQLVSLRGAEGRLVFGAHLPEGAPRCR